MTNITMGLEETEGDILAFEVSDHVLEIAAGTAKERPATTPSQGVLRTRRDRTAPAFPARSRR